MKRPKNRWGVTWRIISLWKSFNERLPNIPIRKAHPPMYPQGSEVGGGWCPLIQGSTAQQFPRKKTEKKQHANKNLLSHFGPWNKSLNFIFPYFSYQIYNPQKFKGWPLAESEKKHCVDHYFDHFMTKSFIHISTMFFQVTLLEVLRDLSGVKMWPPIWVILRSRMELLLPRRIHVWYIYLLIYHKINHSWR